jgi:hypothetical protein
MTFSFDNSPTAIFDEHLNKLSSELFQLRTSYTLLCSALLQTFEELSFPLDLDLPCNFNGTFTFHKVLSLNFNDRDVVVVTLRDKGDIPFDQMLTDVQDMVINMLIIEVQTRELEQQFSKEC